MIAVPITYLFIDGRYLRKDYARRVADWYGSPGKINFERIKYAVSANKAFYYDCPDDQRKTNESEEEFNIRVQNQMEEFDEIRSIDGFHVGLGHLAGKGAAKRQKGVDVLIAVDMLNHAFRKNMDIAYLLAGDADFKPLVESLIHTGVFVNVYADPTSVASQLKNSADAFKQIRFNDYHDWTEDRKKRGSEFALPQSLSYNDPTGDFGVRVGSIPGVGEVKFYSTDTEYLFIPAVRRSYKHDDRGRLERFCELKYGPISWAES